MVVGLLVAVVSFGGGLSVSAEELHTPASEEDGATGRRPGSRTDEVDS